MADLPATREKLISQIPALQLLVNVRLLYEGRDVPQTVDAAQIDRWFEEWTAGMTRKQKADLNKKYATSGELN
jgi:hypothetical protein